MGFALQIRSYVDIELLDYLAERVGLRVFRGDDTFLRWRLYVDFHPRCEVVAAVLALGWLTPSYQGGSVLMRQLTEQLFNQNLENAMCPTDTGRFNRTSEFARQIPVQASIFYLCLLIGPMLIDSVEAVEFLRTKGQDIVAEDGTAVMMRSVGLGNWLLPEGYMWKFAEHGDRPRKMETLVSELIGPQNATRFWNEYRKNYITEADIARIAQLGFNAVRPALNARLFLTEGDDPTTVEEGFALLDQLIAWCRKHGIYVIIDMHGAPGGQTGANIDDSAKDQPELFTDVKNQDRLVDLWTTIAQRYKNEPTVAAYDLLNEPLPES